MCCAVNQTCYCCPVSLVVGQHYELPLQLSLNCHLVVCCIVLHTVLAAPLPAGTVVVSAGYHTATSCQQQQRPQLCMTVLSVVFTAYVCFI
jgi:hypothetical protein